jgi:hypothetical protein
MRQRTARPRNRNWLRDVLQQDKGCTSDGSCNSLGLTAGGCVCSSRRSQPAEPLEDSHQVCVADGFCGLDLIHLAVECGPAYALKLVDRIANASICSEMLAAPEGLADGSVMRALALAAVGKTMGLVGGKDPVSVELGYKIAAPGQIHHQRRSPKS